MKETVHVNIGSVAFTLDYDAYETLKNYLTEVEQHLPSDDIDTLDDIERGIAEMFRERLLSPHRVVTMREVEEAMRRMGHPEQFSTNGRRYRNSTRSHHQPETSPIHIYRSRTNRSIAGVCGGLSEYFKVDPTLIRLMTLLLILFGGLSLWVYILLWVIIPEEPTDNTYTY